MEVTTKISILGSGVAGLSVAAELHQRGEDVQVIDPNGAPREHTCSWWAGGMLSPECEGVIAEDSIVRHGRFAAEWWSTQGAELQQNGTLVVALGRDIEELNNFSRRLSVGVKIEGQQLTDFEPHLAEQFEQALFVNSEAHLNPRKTLQGLYRRLKSQGVKFTMNTKPDGHVIDCRGLAASDHLHDLRGVKGEMVIVKSSDVVLHRPVRLLHPRFPLYIVPRGGGVFMLGATQVESNERGRPTVRSVVELLNAAYALHSAFAESELLEVGVDARPAFPDNLPRIRRTQERVYVNGLFRHGFMLAPALARMTADLMLEGKIPEDFYEDQR